MKRVHVCVRLGVQTHRLSLYSCKYQTCPVFPLLPAPVPLAFKHSLRAGIQSKLFQRLRPN